MPNVPNAPNAPHAFNTPNVQIQLAQLPSDFPVIQMIRSQVFQIEQGVAAELEFDGQDENATHLLAYLDDRPIGTARLRGVTPEVAKVERVAVLKEARGLGIGKALMEKATQVLHDRGTHTILIHAQTPVQEFYQRLGFVAEGEIFTEADIPHVKMKKQLRSPKVTNGSASQTVGTN